MCKEFSFDDWKNPSDEVVKNFVAAFDIVYHKGEQELKELFEKPYSEDTIKKRVKRLNALYSTRIDQTRLDKIYDKLTSKEHGTAFEERVRLGDPSAVAKLAGFCSDRNLFVFATKYCSFLSQYQFEEKKEKDKYPIYDYLVSRALQNFNDKYHFNGNKKIKFEKMRTEKDYDAFKAAVDKFKEKFGLKSTYRDIDKFLWLVGKNLEDKKEAHESNDKDTP